MASVVALSGRRIDVAGAVPVFPLDRCADVAAAIRTRLLQVDARLLVASAACGADLLALEAAKTLGIRRRIVLPFSEALFREQSVSGRPGDWESMFDRACEEAARGGDLVVLDSQSPSDRAYLEAAHALLDESEAAMTAHGCTERLALAVWEGPRHGGMDVTRELVEEARRRGWLTSEILTR